MEECPSEKVMKKREASEISKFDQSTVEVVPAKKLKKTPILATRNVKAQPLTLLQLPLAVLERLLIFLDVSNLEKLGSTCAFFYQLISEMNITTLDFPFSPTFLSKLSKELVIEKKPLLRLRSVQTNIIQDYVMPLSKHHISLQLALLDLSRLRELYLVMPAEAEAEAEAHMFKVLSYGRVYWDLVESISALGHLANITRLDIIVDEDFNLANRIQEMTSLLHLGLVVPHVGPRGPTWSWLESAVAACRAPNLSVTVRDRSRKKTIKVFNNCFVERLTLRLPCNFNLHLAMTELQEVVLGHQEPTCTYPRSTLAERALHCSGLCGVSLASCFQNCPRLKIFAGVQIGSSGQDKTFLKWSNRLKKPFHSDYMSKGGVLDLKAWSRVRGGRWFCRQEALPAETGHDWGDF